MTISAKSKTLKVIEAELEHTAWGRGVYMGRYIVPAARPAQIRAGARKLLDRIMAGARRHAKAVTK